MSFETAIPRGLCSSCMDCPWGDSGWQAFFDESGGSAKFARGDRSIRNMIKYDVESQTLYEQSRDCKWCYMLVTGIKIDLPDGVGFEDLQEWGYDRIHVTMKFHAPLQCDTVKLNSVYVSLRVDGPENRFNMFRLDRLAVWSKPGSLGSDTFFSLSERGDRGPGFDADLASTWINTCRNNHGRCQGEQGGPRMPTRILDLSGSLESDFRLRETEEENAEYACLSYKWGDTNNLEVDFPSLAWSMFHETMSPQDRRLPLTFRDAIKVARSIGINYLWIDALCIWQDDDNDKSLELDKISTYYANCTLVIQASGTDSVSEGFLDLAYRSRNHDVFENHLESFPFKSSDGQKDTIYICPGGKVDWYRKRDQPAAKRGWILQEETLPRRILKFPAGGGMIFHCDSRYVETDDGHVFYDPDVRDPPRYWNKDRLLERREDLTPTLIPLRGRIKALLEWVCSLSDVPGLKPSLRLNKSDISIHFGDNDDADEPSEGTGVCFLPVKGTSAEEAAYAKTLVVLRRAGFPDTPVSTRPPPGVALPEGIHDIWKDLVTEFCARTLTKPSHKLFAIEGLAKAFQEAYGHALGSYHSGLWSHFSPTGLLWRSIRPALLDADFSVPSWSWAAVRAAEYPDPERHTGDLSGGADFHDVDIQLSYFGPTEEDGDEVKQIRLVAKLLDVWWGPNTTPQQEPRKRLSQQEGANYALFQEDGEVLTQQVYPDHLVNLPICGRQNVAMMLGRRYVTGLWHDQDNQGEVLLLRKREDGTYVRVAFAVVPFKDFEEIWEPRFRVETIVLA